MGFVLEEIIFFHPRGGGKTLKIGLFLGSDHTFIIAHVGINY